KVSEIKRIVVELCGNEEYRFYAENSLGKGLQNEIISMADIVANRIKRDDLMGVKRSVNDDDIDEYGEINLNICLFRDKVWNEVTDSKEKAEGINAAMDFGYIRIFNDNGEEFILAKSMNGAVYKVNDSARYFQWFEKDDTLASAERFCDLWYDEMAGGYHNLINIVVDDNAEKTKEELANSLLEAYRINSSTFLADNAYYFNELKIISLEIYDENEYDLFTGVNAEDVLKFRVSYAVNAKNEEALAGSWSTGEGEYEGYMVNGCDVTAVRRDGRWYCVGMSNG
ncbi:MAG: hypothetical protein J6B39_05970, partial [Lachnospiraceae bacterium]|nr:hypothetical protein [Lachnospiraceae bacterium]